MERKLIQARTQIGVANSDLPFALYTLPNRNSATQFLATKFLATKYSATQFLATQFLAAKYSATHQSANLRFSSIQLTGAPIPSESVACTSMPEELLFAGRFNPARIPLSLPS